MKFNPGRFFNWARSRPYLTAASAACFVGGGAVVKSRDQADLKSQMQRWNVNFNREMMMAKYMGCYRLNECESKEEDGLPVYRKTDLQKHKKAEDRIWVSYKDSVYDITDFIKNHPGGSEKILMAAGGPLEQFYEMYPFHKVDSVLGLLKQFKIGKLHPLDQVKKTDIVDFSDMHQLDIKRSPYLVKKQNFAYCSETNKLFLTDDFLTPNSDLYVRNHYAVPELDEDFEDEFVFEMSLLGKGTTEAFPGKQLKSYTLKDLKMLKKQHEVITQMACAGNRRVHTRKHYPNVKGIDWEVGAIGNNKYRGVLVRDLLLDAGFTHAELNSPEMKSMHLVATGMDADFQGVHYKASIKMERVLDPLNEVILAWEMNGDPIPVDHGYPLRLIAPGFIGVRNVKWV